MEKRLSALRAGLRTTYNSAVADYWEHSGEELYFAILEDKYDKLTKANQQIQEVCDLDEESFIEEVVECESFSDVFLRAKVDFISKTKVNSSQPTTSFKFKAIQPVEYDVSPSTWSSFWGQFRTIHEDSSVAEEDKFQYVLRCMKPGTKGYKLVQSYPPHKGNYQHMIEHLKRRFGKDSLVIDSSVRVLLNIVIGEKKLSLSELVDTLGAQIRSLTALGVGSDKYQLFLYPLLEKCLPKDVLETYLQSKQNCDGSDSCSNSTESETDKVQTLMDFLERQVENKEHVDALRTNTFTKHEKTFESKETERFRSASALHSHVSTSSSMKQCIFCDLTSHRAPFCRKAAKLTVSERRDIVKKKRACFKCLESTTHQASACQRNIKCRQCGRQHFDIVCDTASTKSDASLVNTALGNQNVVYLKTLHANIVIHGSARKVRIFLDDGSTKSYITNDLARELGLKPNDKTFLTHGLFGGVELKEEEYFVYNVQLRGLNTLQHRQVTAIGYSKLCHELPGVRDNKLLEELKQHNITLTDSVQATEIDLLLGSDMIPRILTGRMQILKSGVVATETVFGWVVQGVGRKQVTKVNSCFNVARETTLWDLDTLGIEPPEQYPEDVNEAVSHFKNTVKVSEEGRFVVSLPWRSGHPPLCSNRDLAEARLQSLTKKLKETSMLQAYDSVLQEWLTEGIIEKVKGNDTAIGIEHYLPHLAVQKSNSRSFKIRPVFDASAHRQGYVSLNQCLNKGPNLIPLILPLLLKFRMGRYGLTADIKAAFLMLEIAEKDRDALRFLWWHDGQIVIYRHKRVVFGTASSPFLLNASLYHLLEEATEWNITAEKLKSAFYVDNLLLSCESESDLTKLKMEAQALLATRKFELRDWVSNLGSLSENQKETENVLGLCWDVKHDVLTVDTSAINKVLKGNMTKRKLLSLANSFYDPLGSLAAVTLVPKLIIKEAWLRGIEWDEELPFDLLKKLQAWTELLHLLQHCAIPRCLGVLSGDELSLHLFSDASGKSFGACAFLRVGGASPILRFVVAKARVGPRQSLTIPRMELLGACLAARLYKSIVSSLELEVIESHFWTDSTVVLSWLKNEEPWKTFVGNRVTEIKELTDVSKWRHVPGTLNPADLLSRGCDVQTFLHKKWLDGPDWLRQPPDTWPKNCAPTPDEIALTERKNITCINVNLTEEREVFCKALSYYFSKYSKLLNMVAWMFRFINNSKRNSTKRTSQTLSSDELEEAERRWVLTLQNTVTINPKNLRLFKDHTGIYRIKTKIIMGTDLREFREPMVIVDSTIVRRMITYIHEKANHASVQTTLVILRNKFWLIKGRKVVRQIITKCVICNKFDSKAVVPLEAPLPVDRFNIKVASFEICGVDLTGHLWLKGKTKAWIVLFTCAVYRCVHFELVTSLSTDSFLQAVRRMMARKGDVSIFWCDNGTNFVGADNALKTVSWEEIAAKGATQRLKFRFICPGSPWFGGWWEIMNKLLKNLLRKSLGNAYLNYEEMLTVLCDCERTVNSRPLTYLSDDANELSALTPDMFIHERRSGGMDVSLDLIDGRSLNKRVIYLQNVRKHLKERFRREYLSQLVNFRQNKTPKSELKVGDIVLVGNENVKRIDWPLAKVLEIFKGRDGESRIAKVKTATSELLRPFRKLYPLEVRPVEGQELLKGEVSAELRPVEGEELLKGEVSAELKSPQKHSKFGRLIKRPKKLDL